MKLSGWYYDGITSRRQSVILLLLPDHGVQLSGEEVDKSYPRSAIQCAPQLGSLPCTLTFSDGSQCETDYVLIAPWIGKGRVANPSLLSTLETRWRYALLAMVLLVLMGWGSVVWGIPWLAKQMAPHLPDMQSLGQEGVAWLDQHKVLRPTRLDGERQTELEGWFIEVKQAVHRPNDHLLLRRGGKALGANAFYVPGFVLLTDELVDVLSTKPLIVAVMAHEMGHGVHHHLTRMMLQNSGITLLLFALSGDPTMVGSLTTTLPTFLLQTSYSREFEDEADQYATLLLPKLGFAARDFATALELLEQQRPQKEDSIMSGYLSTHPATAKRLQAIRGGE